MTTRDEDILDFDFFGEEEPPSWDEPTDEGSGVLRATALRGGTASALPLVGQPHTAAPARGADRAGDPHRRAARRLGRGVRERPEDRALSRLHDRDRRDRKRVRAARSAALHDADDAGPEAGGSRRQARRIRPDGRESDADRRGPRISRPAARRTGGRSRSASASASTACAGCRRRSRRPRTQRTPPSQARQLAAQTGVCSRATSSGRTRSGRVPRLSSRTEGIEGIEVPTSVFVTAEEVTTAGALAAIWQRIQGASTGGTPSGLHGSGISYVKALPSGQLLSTTTETTILVTDELAFEVGVEDTGRQPGGPAQGDARRSPRRPTRSSRRRRFRSSTRVRPRR